MDKRILMSLIHQPEFLKEDLMEELNEVIQKYPYFAIPHFLLAKSLHEQNSHLAPQKIRRAALYAYSRSLLKKFIMEKVNRINVEEEAHHIPENPLRNTVDKIQKELDEFNKKMEQLSPEELDKELAQITESYITPEYNLDSSSVENSEQLFTETQKAHHSIIDKFLKIETAFPSFTEEEITEENAIKRFEQGDVQGAIAIYEKLKMQNPERADYYQTQINIFSMSLDEIVQGSEDIGDSLVTETASTLMEDSSHSLEHMLAQEGSNEEITEEKAITYFNEGDVQKAIEIYRKLMLLFPEKKSYFASQIEILKS